MITARPPWGDCQVSDCGRWAARPEPVWVFGWGGAGKMLLCADHLDGFTQNGHDRTARELGGRAARGEPPEGYEVVAVGGKLDGKRWHRRDSTDAVLVAFGSASQWWDEFEAMHWEWDALVSQVDRGGGRVEVVAHDGR